MKKYSKWLIFLLSMLMVLGGCGNFGKNTKESQQTGGQEQSNSALETEGRKEEPEQNNSVSKTGNDSEEPGQDNTEDSKQEKKEELADTKNEKAPESGKQEEPEPPAVPTLNEETVEYAREEVVTTSSVNVRTAPSTDSEVYQTVPRRSEFVKTADDGTWSAVEIEGKEYYIASEFLKLKSEMTDNGYLVVIDAGHQGKGNSEQGPSDLGPRKQRRRFPAELLAVSAA